MLSTASLPVSTRLLLLVLLPVVLFACDSSSPPDQAVSPNILEIGDSWTYDVRLTMSPVDSAAVSPLASSTLHSFTLQMRVAKNNVDLAGSSRLVELEVSQRSAPDSVARTWYRQSPDSLIAVASEVGQSVPGSLPLLREASEHATSEHAPHHFKRGLTGLPLLVRRRLQRSLRSSSETPRDTTFREDSRIVLQAPLEQGASWTSFEDPFLSTRTVAGQTPLETRAGRFEAVEIQNQLPEQAPSLEWSDFYAEVGLVRRTVTDTIQRVDEFGEESGRFAYREEYTLTDYQD